MTNTNEMLIDALQMLIYSEMLDIYSEMLDPTHSAQSATIRDLIRDEYEIAQIIDTDAFAIELLNDTEIDLIDAIDAIHSLLAITPESPNSLAFRNLCDRTEICPIHRCDYRICIDDQIAECAHLHIQ